MAQQPLVGQGFLFIEASRSHSDTPHSAGPLCMRDQSTAEAFTWQHTTLIHAPGGIQNRNPSKQETAELHLRPRGHWDRGVIDIPPPFCLWN
jgi:hypothetical protein